MHNKTNHNPSIELWKLLIIYPQGYSDFSQTLISSKYSLTHSVHLSTEIRRHYSNLRMKYLDVDSLITNISLDENIDICISNSCNVNENPYKITHIKSFFF